MFCESWREALSGAALRDEEPSREVRLHLAACCACRTAFAQERELFAGIDYGLQALANSEVPDSLIPRVRVAINEQPAGGNWGIPLGALVGATLLLIAGIAYTWTRAPHPASLAQPVAAVAPPIHASSKNSSESSAPSVATSWRPVSPLRSSSARTAPVRPEPEILVSTEEQANLQLYLNRQRASSVNNAARLIIADAQIKPLEIARMELPQLNIEPLQGGDSR